MESVKTKIRRYGMTRQNDFWRKLAPLVFPIAFQQLMLSLVSASDAVMLGLVDQSSLSAASLATQIAFVLDVFVFGLSCGGSILAAQYWGKGSREDVEQVLAIMLRPMLFVGMVFTAAAMFVPEMLMRIYTADETLIELGAGYLQAVSLSYLLYALCSCYLCIMRNSGRTGMASIIIGSGVVMNIVLNAVLIFGLFGAPVMGILGAAVATTITRAFQFVCILAEMARKDSLKLRRKDFFGRHLPLTGDYIKYTVTVTYNNLIWGLGISMGSVILGHLGNDAVAANSIASVVKNLVNCFCMGVANGGAIMVGNELGAGQLERGREYGDRVVKLAWVSAIATFVLLVSMTPLIVKLATLTPQAESYLRGMIVICGINLIGMSNNSTMISGLFCAGGDTKFGAICDTVVLWGIVVPLGFLAAFVWDWPVLAVYCIICSDEIIKLPAVWRHYLKYEWVKDLTKTKEETP